MGNNSSASVIEEPAVDKGSPNGAKAPRDVERKSADKNSDEAPKPQGPPRTVWREYFESLVVTAIMALFGMTFVVQAVKVPTGSMQNTILIGDHLLVNKFIFAPGPHLPFLPQRDIRRGDIIVFKYPGKYQGEERFRYNAEVDDTAPNNIPYKTNYVKRVIGLPGDVVEVRDRQVLVNGRPLEEHQIAALNSSDIRNTPGDESQAPLTIRNDATPTSTGPYNVYYDPERHPGPRPSDEKFVVPPGHYFAMGDNRDNSQDSRFWGYVPRDAIVGRAMFVYWSYDESAPHSDAAFPFSLISDFINNTRWSRTGTMVK